MCLQKKKYDVFVSYRRDGGYETALPIVEKLRSAGYRVFFDLESLNSGKFNEQLLGVINDCKDFVLVLPANGLDRCVDKDDWVRREVTCALAGNKNIIPVMLKGFEWPATLPEDMKDLPNYQGISAASPEYFDLAVERLKGYLKSGRHIVWQKWLVYGGVSIASLIVLAAVAYFAFLQLAKPVCKTAGTQMTYAMNVIHEMYVVNEDFNRAWESYIEQRQKSSAATKVRLDSNFMANVDGYYIPAIERLRKSYPAFPPLGSYDSFLLGLYDVDASDVSGSRFIVNEQGEESINNFNMHKLAIVQDMFNVEALRSMREGHNAERQGMNVLYYHYLGFMSHLPKSAWESHVAASPQWHLMPTVSENLDAAEYVQLADKEQKKLEKSIESMNSFVEMLSNHTNRLEEYLSDMEKEDEEQESRLEEQQKSTVTLPETNPEEEATKQRINDLQEDVSQKRAQLSEMDKNIVNQFESFKKKFAIDGSEGQYLKWGKVCKAANHLALTVRFNKQRAAEGMSPALTNEQTLDYVIDQLNAYQSYHPETRPYVTAAKAFYADVAAGKRPLEGMVIMGTQNDEEHPLLRIGDIVVELNGKIIDSAKSFDAASKISETGIIRFLRLENGVLREINAPYPKTKVNIGLMYLKD